MAYDARAIANWFLDRAGQDGKQLTQMQLQKLVYISHGWHLALVGDSLILDPVEAWKFGPVIRSLYREFADYGKDPITRKARVFDGSTLEEHEISIRDYERQISPQKTELLVNRVWDVYGGMSGSQLSALTHEKGTPWYHVWNEEGGALRRFAIIPNKTIKEHFEWLARGAKQKA